MSQESGEVSELFGSQLQAEGQPSRLPPFQDGVYSIVGVSMKKGVYKSGKWQGKPYARFVYTLQDGPNQRQVSQMLPWFPGKAFFEINFQRLCGMKLSEFAEHCRREGLDDAKAQSRFFLTLFRDWEYKAEIRQRGEWLNVWELKQRVGRTAETGQSEGSGEVRSDTETASQSTDSPLSAIAPEQLQALSQEEFGVAPESLSQAQQQTLAALIREQQS